MSQKANRKPNYDPLVPPEFEIKENLNKMAKKSHELYMAVEERYVAKENRANYHPKNWDDLDNEFKRSSRNQIRTLPDRIEKVDLRIGYMGEDNPIMDLSTTEYPEILARDEHERWCHEKVADGYRYGKVRDNKAKTNPFLRPWKDLPEEGKEKALVIFKNLSTILAEAGFCLYKRNDGYRNTYEAKGAANIPLVLSFTGHRDIDDQSAIRLKTETTALFEKFHREFPHTDLILLTSLAEGADMIAAETALDNHVRVSVILPCRKEIYRESLKEAYRERFDILFKRATENTNEYEFPSDTPLYRDCSAYMLAHSHMLIAAWDGYMYEAKPGGTYDTLRMACLGLDYDLSDRHGDSYLSNIEDTPVYWIPATRKSQDEIAAKNERLAEDTGCYYISSVMNSENAKKCSLDKERCENGKKHMRDSSFLPAAVVGMMSDGLKRSVNGFFTGIKTVVNGKKKKKIDVSSKYGMPQLIKNNCARYIPDHYYGIYSRIDEFNRDAGTEPNDYSSSDDETKIHRCLKGKKSVLDGIYSMGAADSFESWSKNRSGLNNLVPDMEKSAIDSEETADEYKEVRQTLNKIRFRRYGDATAMRFDLALRLSEIYERKNKAIMHILTLSIVMNYFLFGLFMATSGALLLIILYFLSLITGNLILWVHHGREHHRKMVEYRCLAESLRVRYYLSLLNINGDLSLSFYDHIRNKTEWVKAALISWDLHCCDDPVASKIPETKMADAVYETWVQYGLFHHKDKAGRNKVLYAKNKLVATISVAGIFVIMPLQMVACLKILKFNIFTFDGWSVGDVALLTAVAFTALFTLKLMMIFFSTSHKFASQTKKRIIGASTDEMRAKVKLFELADIRIREQNNIADYYHRMPDDYILEHSTFVQSATLPDNVPANERARVLRRCIDDQIVIEKKKIFKELGEECIRENGEWVFANNKKDVKMLTTKEV